MDATSRPHALIRLGAATQATAGRTGRPSRITSRLAVAAISKKESLYGCQAKAF